MKIKLVSDLHLEFSDIDIKNNEGCDVLILSGDIMIAQDLHDHPETSYGMYSNVNLADLGRRQRVALRFRDFLKRCSLQFPHVVYVAGNHEFYHGKWNQTIDTLRETCANFSNIHFLERDTVTINNVLFIGGTLWTDMNKQDSMTMWHVGRRMSDFELVKNSKRMVQYKHNVYKKDANGDLVQDEKGNLIVERVDDYERPSRLQPEDVVLEFDNMIQYIRMVVEDKHDHKFVVVGHHAPSKISTKPWYKDDFLMNGAYSSDLNEFILERPQIKLWTHGHTHDDFDYMVGTTRVVCNPRGYINYEGRADKFKLKYLEV